MTFTEEGLGTIQAALAAFTRILKDVDGAKTNGYVPPCFNPNNGTKQLTADLLSRISKRSMN